MDTILKLPSIALSRRLPIIEQKSITEIGNMLRGYGENLNAILCTFIVKNFAVRSASTETFPVRKYLEFEKVDLYIVR